MKVYFTLFFLFSLSLFAREKVLIIHSYHENFKWTKDVNEGINSVLKKRYKEADFYLEYMDTKRHVNKEHYKNIFNILNNKYKNTKFDLIISSDNNAFDFIKKYNKSLFNEVPVVFTGVNYVKKEDTLGYDNFTGINQVYDLNSNYELIKKLHPKVKNIYTIVDKTTTGKVIKRKIKSLYSEYKKNINDEINYEIIQNVTKNELKDKIKSFPKNSVILFTIFNRSSDDVFFKYYEISEFISKITKSPIYSTSYVNLEHGVIGGYLTSGYYHGKKAARIGLDILNGKEVKNIPIEYEGYNKYIFDYKKLKSHNINIDLLPKNSLFLNKPTSIYELYKFELTLLLLVFVILIVFVLILLKNLRGLKKADKEIQELNKNLEKKVESRTYDLEKSNNELKDLLENIKLTKDKLVHSEKMASLGGLVAGVSHEINTPVGISVTGISHFLDITKNIENKFLSNTLSEEDFTEYLETSNELARLIDVNLQKTAHLVRSFKQIAVDQTSEEKRSFEVNEYMQSVIFSINNIIKKTNIEININCEEDIKINSYPGSYSQVISNLILNSIRHGYEEKEKGIIDISIYKQDNTLDIIYKDDGKGISEKNLPKIFDPFFTTNREKGGTGLGLNIIYNIITNKLNGSIKCESVEKLGVKFTISTLLD